MLAKEHENHYDWVSDFSSDLYKVPKFQCKLDAIYNDEWKGKWNIFAF